MFYLEFDFCKIPDVLFSSAIPFAQTVFVTKDQSCFSSPFQLCEKQFGKKKMPFSKTNGGHLFFASRC